MLTDDNNNNNNFNTNELFAGGAGMFIQYHDIIKPVYLYAIVKMIATKNSFGLPINIIKNMSIISIIEWYMNRRYINPFKCLDYNHQLTDDILDNMLWGYLLHDKTIYQLSPALNISIILDQCKKQNIQIPIFVYSEKEEPYIKEDIKNIFSGMDVKYIFGDLTECLKQTTENFTYIFSDIELVKRSSEILMGTCSHILLSADYRYNYIDFIEIFKYDLTKLMKEHPYVRIGITESVNKFQLVESFISMKETK